MSSFQETIDKLQEKAKVLTGERKKRGKSVPEGLASLDDIRNFTTLASHPGLHSASVPGILSIDINANNTSKILTGGADKTATVFNKDVKVLTFVYIGCLEALLVSFICRKLYYRHKPQNKEVPSTMSQEARNDQLLENFSSTQCLEHV
jgi:hypothetical protein